MGQTLMVKGNTVTGIYSDKMAPALREMGKVKVRRASHVEPTEDGTGWTADMTPVGGGILGPFALREDALAAEVAWLNEHMPDVEV